MLYSFTETSYNKKHLTDSKGLAQMRFMLSEKKVLEKNLNRICLALFGPYIEIYSRNVFK